MNRIRHSLLMFIPSCILFPCLAMDTDPAETLLKALLDRNLRAFEDRATLHAAIAIAEKLVNGKIVAIPQIKNRDQQEKALEALPDTMRILELLKKQKKKVDTYDTYIQTLNQMDLADYEAEERERVKLWNLRRQQEQIRIQQAAAQHKALYAQAFAAICDNNSQQLLNVLNQRVLSADDLGDLLGDACQREDGYIMQLLIDAIERMQPTPHGSVHTAQKVVVASPYEVRSSYHYNPGGNSNNE